MSTISTGSLGYVDSTGSSYTWTISKYIISKQFSRTVEICQETLYIYVATILGLWNICMHYAAYDRQLQIRLLRWDVGCVGR